MPGKRSNISPLDETILRFLFSTNEDNKESYKSNSQIKLKTGESGHIIPKKLERLREFGLVKKFEEKKGSRIDKYWSITNTGRYCTLAKLNGHSELKEFIEKSIKADNYSPSRFITTSSWVPDNIVMLDLISDGDWDSIDELIDRVRKCVDNYRYNTIMRIVKSWFMEFNGKLPSNLKMPLKITPKQAS